MITSLKTEDIDCVCEECGKTFNLDNPKAVLSTDRDLWSVKCPHCEQWGYMNPINVAQETKQMSNKYYIGLDPGSKGALTVLHGESIESVAFDDYDISDICYKLRDLVNYNSVYAVVEDVHAVFGSSAKGTFEFGYNKGWIVGMLTALNIPYSMIPPKKWQSGVWERCDKVMEGKKVKTKETSINCAKRIFPGVDLRRTPKCKNPHDGICDSLLMAEYARRNNF